MADKSKPEMTEKPSKGAKPEAVVTVAPEGEAKAKPSAALVVPEAVERKFKVTADNRELTLADKGTGEKMAVMTEKRIEVVKSSPETVAAAIALAKENGWSRVKLSGPKELKAAMWSEAQKQGIDAKGYRPTKEEREKVERERSRGVPDRETLNKRTIGEKLEGVSRSIGDRFANATQKERLATPEMRNAAKMLAVMNGYIDKAYGPGTQNAAKAREMMAKHVGQRLDKGQDIPVAKVARTVEVKRPVAQVQAQSRDRKDREISR